LTVLTSRIQPARVRDRLQRLLPALDRPLVPAALAGVCGLILAGALLLASGGDVSELVHAAPPYTSERAAGSLNVGAARTGFDGQFFYRLALSPFSTAADVGGVRFDIGSYRQQRIGYPLVVRLASGGDRDLVPWALLGVNVAGLAVLGGVGGALARDAGRHALLGLLFVAYPGFLYTLGLDLAEIVASALLLSGLLCVRRGRALAAALLLVFAVLTRETTAVGPAGIVAAWAWLAVWRRPERPPLGGLLAGLVPLVAAGAWQLYLLGAWGRLGLESASENNLRSPFMGLLAERAAFAPTSAAGLLRLASLGLVVLVLALGLSALGRSVAPLHEKVALVLATVLLTLLSAYICAGATSFMRACTEAYLLAGLVVVGDPRWRRARLLASPVAAVWALSAVAVLIKAS
jgi:hypothetical protein